MNKNYIPYAFYFALAVTGILGILSFLNTEKTILGYTLKPVNVFSDILIDSSQIKQQLIKDTLIDKSSQCPADVVCFRNFTKERYPGQ